MNGNPCTGNPGNLYEHKENMQSPQKRNLPAVRLYNSAPSCINKYKYKEQDSMNIHITVD